MSPFHFSLFSSPPPPPSSSSSSSSCAQASGDACSAALLADALEGMPSGPRCSPPSSSGVALAGFVRIAAGAVVRGLAAAAAAATAAAAASVVVASKLPLLLLLSSSRLELLALPPPLAAPPPAAPSAEAASEGKAPEPPRDAPAGAPPNLADDAADSGLENVRLVAARCSLALCAAVDAYGLIVGVLVSVADSGRATALDACSPATERPNAIVTSLRLGGSNSR